MAARGQRRRTADSSASRSVWRPYLALAVHACRTLCISRRRRRRARKITEILGADHVPRLERRQTHGRCKQRSHGIAAKLISSLLLNAAVWRHHVNGGGRYRANSCRCEFNRDVVDIKIQNSRVLLVVFILIFVHRINLPIQSLALFSQG